MGSSTGARLAAAPMEVVGRFADASNATLLARLLDRDPRPLAVLRDALGRDVGIEDLDPVDLVVYKPRDGEQPLWDFPEGTLHRREVAAALVDRAMGADLVPYTVLRDDAPHGPGSVQRFVPHDMAQHYFTVREPALTGQDDLLRERLILLASFDLVIDNADRKGGHVLVEDGDGPLALRLRAVDHGVSFNVEPKHRTVIWDLASCALGPQAQASLDRLLIALDGVLGEQLAQLLDPAEVAMTRERAHALRAVGVLPEPVGPRPFPWPLL
ncbi:MAG: SCO1664 family protein [Actinomycetota bacterium]|nr:SCO1664 family protein [Actinomycetota bacterium]